MELVYGQMTSCLRMQYCKSDINTNLLNWMNCESDNETICVFSVNLFLEFGVLS